MEPSLLPDLEALYTDLHAHPELSMHETRTATLAARRLSGAGFEVTTGVGNTGVVGLLRNGDGPTVMLRADMDALPVKEATGLPYASAVTATNDEGETVPVMHACGHDMHVTWLVGATTLLGQARDAWSGTLMAVFQPAEETGAGAQAMIDDGLFSRFPKPDVVLGQHVMVGSAGDIAARAGIVTAAADSLQVRMFGRGAHGSMPEASIDPVVMAASTVMRLQTIVSRELAATESAVVTVGSLRAGEKENIIPDQAVIKLNVRTFDAGVRTRVLAAITRIVDARPQRPGPPGRPRSRSSTATPWASTTPAPVVTSPRRSAGISTPIESVKSGLSPGAKTSDGLDPSGTFRRCSGSSEAPTLTSTRGQRQRARSTSCRVTTAPCSHPSCTRPWRRAWRPSWLPP